MDFNDNIRQYIDGIDRTLFAHLVSFLGHVHEATKMLEGDKYPTLSFVLYYRARLEVIQFVVLLLKWICSKVGRFVDGCLIDQSEPPEMKKAK